MVDDSEDITITGVARSMDVAYNTAWELLNTERLPNDTTAEKMETWISIHGGEI
jgi:plasmid maintenance system antidote protein VapI